MVKMMETFHSGENDVFDVILSLDHTLQTEKVICVTTAGNEPMTFGTLAQCSAN